MGAGSRRYGGGHGGRGWGAGGREGSRGALGGRGASRLGQDSAYFRMAGRVLDSPELLGILDSCSVPRLRDAGSRRAEKARIRGGGKCCYAAVHVCIV